MGILDAPLDAVFILVLLVTVTFIANFTATAGAKRCPAAVSATLMTAVNMGVGYLAQVFVFRQPPTAAAICGACLMFVSMVIMALSRLPFRQKIVGDAAPSSPRSVASTVSTDTATHSFASFIASEYAEKHTPEETMTEAGETSTVRQRHLSSVSNASTVMPSAGGQSLSSPAAVAFGAHAGMSPA